MIKNKVLAYFLEVVCGLVFIVSAWMKLFPVEPYELFLIENGITGWRLAPYLARIIISFELTLGLLLLAQLGGRRIRQMTIGVLLLFSSFLIYFLAVNGNSGDCGCFGEHFKLSPLQGLIKNGCLIIVLILLRDPNKIRSLRLKKLYLALCVIIPLGVVFIVEAPDDFFNFQSPGLEESKLLNEKDFSEFYNQEGEQLVMVLPEKVIILFVSSTCKYCKLATRKIAVLKKELELPVYVVFLGPKKELQDFWKESHIPYLPHKFMAANQFFYYSSKSLPTISLVKGNKIIKNYGLRTIDVNEIKAFFGSE